jgi:hypothetical protein
MTYSYTYTSQKLNKNKKELLELMEKFLNGTIDGQEFSENFIELRRKDRRSKKLSGFLTGLSCELDHFTENYESQEFYDSIKNWFLKLQKI